MKLIEVFIVLIFIIFLIITAIYYWRKPENPQGFFPQKPTSTFAPIPTNTQKVENQSCSAPIKDYQKRVTKKPFGVYITPQNSPVQPERFTGHHTGTDFEILPGEENQKVEVFSFCTGKIIFKGSVSGYGGVLVQSCKINNEDITVLYGHLKLTSIQKNKGEEILQGSAFAELGKAFSTETDGERKHLHFAIHKGTAIDFKGYVQQVGDLSSWLNPLDILNNCRQSL